MPRNPDWYDLNSTRPYPIDDGATCVDDEGRFFPTHFIADLCLTWPEELGHYAHISAFSATDNLVTLAILVSDDLDGVTCVPLAMINLVKPFAIFRMQELTPLQDFTAGRIVFGPGVLDQIPYSARFATPRQSYFTRKTAKPLKHQPISGVRVLYAPQACQGVVSLLGGSDIEIVRECREMPYDVSTLDSVPRSGYCETEGGGDGYPVVVLRLKDTEQQTDRNVLQLYQPTGLKAPESGECRVSPIEFLGPVGPDCDGNITIEFKGDFAVLSQIIGETWSEDGVSVSESLCGFIIQGNVGLDELCAGVAHLPSADGALPSEYGDLCCSTSFSASESLSAIQELTNYVLYDEAGPVLLGVPEFEAPPWLFAASPTLLIHGYFFVASQGGSTYASSNSTNSLAGYDVVLYAESREVWTAELMGEILQGPVGAWHNLGVVGGYVLSGEPYAPYDLVVAELDWDGYVDGRKLFRLAWFDGWNWQTLDSIEVPNLALHALYRITLRYSGGTASATYECMDTGETGTIGCVQIPAEQTSRRFGFMSRRAAAAVYYFAASY